MWMGLYEDIRDSIISHVHMVVNRKLNIVIEIVIFRGLGTGGIPGYDGLLWGELFRNYVR